MAISEVTFSPRKALLRMLLLLIWAALLLYLFFSGLSKNHEPEYIFLVDNSLSMSVQDILPIDSHSSNISRLDTSKDFIKKFLQKKSPRAGLITFSEDITIQTPITDDIIQLENALSGISPIIYGGGSDIYKAISSVSEIYSAASNLEVIILSDAESFEKNEEKFSKNPNIHFTLVTIGTEKGGTMLLGYDTEWKPLYKQFDGKNAISAISKSASEKIASYFSMKNFFLEKETESEKIINSLQAGTNSQSSFTDFIFPIGAILLFAISLISVYNFPRTHHEN